MGKRSKDQVLSYVRKEIAKTSKRNWSEQGIEPGNVVRLQFTSELSSSSAEVDNYVVGNYENTHYSLVSLSDGEVIAIADSIDELKDIAEEGCDSDIELVDSWPNVTIYYADCYDLYI